LVFAARAADVEQSTEETCALQLARQTLLAEADADESCSIGDQVKCPGSGNRCEGNQCCPGSTKGGKTFPCPSADPAWESQCESPDKQADCIAKDETCAIGDRVKCPGSGNMCAGNQCCPRSTKGGKTFPCPSADPDWTSECESPDKQEDCVAMARALHCPGSPASGTQPDELSAYYHDLHDDNNKKIQVSFATDSDGTTMVIVAPDPSDPHYVNGVGRNWTVTAAVKDDCTAPSINFNVPNKPNPPDMTVKAQFHYGVLGDLPFVKKCLEPEASLKECGATAKYPDLYCQEPVWALVYPPAGNVWVRLDD